MAGDRILSPSVPSWQTRRLAAAEAKNRSSGGQEVRRNSLAQSFKRGKPEGLRLPRRKKGVRDKKKSGEIAWEKATAQVENTAYRALDLLPFYVANQKACGCRDEEQEFRRSGVQ